MSDHSRSNISSGRPEIGYWCFDVANFRAAPLLLSLRRAGAAGTRWSTFFMETTLSAISKTGRRQLCPAHPCRPR